jgi:hypothetical protein
VLAFSGKRSCVPVVKASDPDAERWTGARAVVPHPRWHLAWPVPASPHDPIICDYCAYGVVCRKDYVHD